ncbi:carbohydrate ABC transporter permease [Paenibacillus chondroitinus]|uniref:Carbohydrate ABC transporter permease n=1 Tax=Paenibacillus chondroitinus TaxID=59842 RepID=A0ABU6D9V5_9BACL|nr:MULTISPECIES: carbohydrate ABC transporter permease [Paenibacillus]MCY9659744.1 carbohydrate ABC transporter permease [Paenibacillus anseongense]MEB4794077.1 carbohydrate ABC transporter permease [Paenibacillus chondroitinus]
MMNPEQALSLKSRKSTTRIVESSIDRVYLFFVYLFLIICLVIVAYPLIYIVSSSFSSSSAVISGKVWLLPVEPTLRGYQAVFQNPQILKGYGNSLFYLVVGTLISVSLTITAAYPLSRKNFYGRNVITALFVFTMLFSGGLIPYYLTVKGLGMLDTRWAMIIPGAISVWQVILARTFFQTSIPSELTEAAHLDGCSDFKFLTRIVIPLSKPIIAVLVLMYAIGYWNSYFEALIFLKTANLYPLQLILRNILILNSIDPTMIKDVRELAERQGLKELLKYSLIVVASAPVLILYPFVQKHFVKGLLIGSLKG